MAGLIVCIEILVIVFLFSSGVFYYWLLYKFSASVKRMKPDVWGRARQAAPDRATDLSVAYRLISEKKLGAERESLDEQSALLCQKARRWLYVSMSSFMMVLVYGLYLSLNK